MSKWRPCPLSCKRGVAYLTEDRCVYCRAGWRDGDLVVTTAADLERALKAGEKRRKGER